MVHVLTVCPLSPSQLRVHNTDVGSFLFRQTSFFPHISLPSPLIYKSCIFRSKQAAQINKDNYHNTFFRPCAKADSRTTLPTFLPHSSHFQGHPTLSSAPSRLPEHRHIRRRAVHFKHAPCRLKICAKKTHQAKRSAAMTFVNTKP